MGEDDAEEDLVPLRPITHLLKENLVEDWDPRVQMQLLEFQYRECVVCLWRGLSFHD